MSIVNRIGVPVRTDIASTEESEVKMYTVDLVFPLGPNGDKPVTHLFTEKELIRATKRYDSEKDLLSVDFSGSVVGYAGATTFFNRGGTLTTRCLIKFKPTNVPGLFGPEVMGLFTTREVVRSRKRVQWFSNQGWFSRLKDKLKGMLQ